MASGSSGSNVLPWFLGISALAVLTGGALTAAEALVAEEAYQANKSRRRPPERPARVEAAKAPSRIRKHVEAALSPPPPSYKPSAPPGSVSPRPTSVAVQRASPTAPPGAADPRLEAILVGMGFKAAEAKMAIGKLPPSAAKVALGDQVKAALAHLSK